MAIWVQDFLAGDFSERVLAVLIDCGIKGFVLLALSSFLVLLMRRSSAAARHLVWTLALMGLLLLPLLSLVVPEWRVPILPGKALLAEGHEGQVQPRMPAPPAPSDPRNNGATSISPSISSINAENNFSIPIMGAGVSIESNPPIDAPHHSKTFMIISIWLVIALAVFMPFLAGLLMVWKMAHGARKINENEWPEMPEIRASMLGHRKSIPILFAESNSMPMAIGLFRSTILLPSTITNWPEEKRRAVLLHELAHVKRRDCLTHAIARAAASLHWFNPLVWLALRCLRIERERACDDLVLLAGERASAYADNLLQIASTMHAGSLASAAAVTMAKKSQLEGRLLAILDATRNRRALRWGALALGVLLILAITIPLGMIKFGEARVFSKMTPQQRAQFQEWYTRIISISPEALRAQSFNPDKVQPITDYAIKEFNHQWSIFKDTAIAVEKAYSEEEYRLKNTSGTEQSFSDEFIRRHRDRLKQLEPLLAAFETVVQRPDYTMDAWRMIIIERAPGADPNLGTRFVPLRCMARLIYQDAVIKQKENLIAEAIESADTLVGCAQINPFSVTINKMVALAILEKGVKAYESIISQATEPHIKRLIMGNLKKHRAKLQFYPETAMNPLILEHIGMVAEIAVSGVRPDLQNKTGYEIMLETMRVRAAFMEQFGLSQSANPAERKKLERNIASLRKEAMSLSGEQAGPKGALARWVQPINAATLYSVALPGLEKGREKASQTLQRYDLIGESASRTSGKTASGEFSLARRKPLHKSQLQGVRQQIYILRHFLITDRPDEWIAAIRKLIEIGQPAVPELSAELLREGNPQTKSAVIFTLRAIGDRRVLPLLIDQINKVPESNSDHMIGTASDENSRFMRRYSWGSAGNQVSFDGFSFGRPINEIAFTLEDWTNHREGDNYKLPGSASERVAVASRWREWVEKHMPVIYVPQIIEEIKSWKMLSQSDPVEEAGAAAFGPFMPQGNDLKFGSTQTLTLAVGPDNNQSVDFDTGNIISSRGGNFSDNDRDWIKENGIDGRAYIDKSRQSGGIVSSNCIVWRMPKEKWEDLRNIERVSHLVRVNPPEGSFSINPEYAPFPHNYIFRTEQGSMGILQIQGLNPEKTRVVLQYALLQANKKQE